MRIFISIRPDEATCQRLVELQSGIDHARWVAPEQFHITLRFIGGMGPDRLQELAAVLSDIQAAPFTVSVRHVGTFPHGSSRQPPTVLWAGLAPSDELEHLAWTIEDHVQMIGLRPTDRVFHGHITLARLRDADRDQVRTWLHKHDMLELPPFTARSFELVNSALSGEGAEYDVLQEYPFPQPPPATPPASSRAG